VYGGFTQTLDWLDQPGNVVLTEERQVTVYDLGPGLRLMDVALTFHASEGPVTFGDTKEGGLLSVRVATSMDAKGQGRIENADGGIQEPECWGKRAAWCDYSGPVGGQVVGITFMDHPRNPLFPTHWHVRAYGLMTANPFGLHDFYRDPEHPHRGDWTIPAGESRAFYYRVLIHPGDAAFGRVRAHYQDFAHPPRVVVLD